MPALLRVVERPVPALVCQRRIRTAAEEQLRHFGDIITTPTVMQRRLPSSLVPAVHVSPVVEQQLNQDRLTFRRPMQRGAPQYRVSCAATSAPLSSKSNAIS